MPPHMHLPSHATIALVSRLISARTRMFALLIFAFMPYQGDCQGIWNFPTGDRIDSSPALGWDGTIYVGSDDFQLHAVNPDGTQREGWEFTGTNWITASPAIGPNGTIYIGDWDFYLYAIDPETGNKNWVFEAADFIYSSPAIGPNGEIYFGSGDYFLYALDPTGGFDWFFETDDWITSSPAVGPDGIIYFGSWDGFVYAVDPHGLLVWEYFAESPVLSSPALANNGVLYIGAGNKLVALNAATGLVLWEHTTGGLVDSSPAVGPDGVVYVGSADSKLYAFRPGVIPNTLNRVKWYYETEGPIFSSPAVAADGSVFFASDDHHLYSVSQSKQAGQEKGVLNWRINIGGVSESSPLIAPDGSVYVGSGNGKLYAAQGDAASAPSTWACFRGHRARDGSWPKLYNRWIEVFSLPVTERLPEADPDGDGIVNLMEYALGSSPVEPNRGILPTLPSLLFQQDLQKVDLLYLPEYSENLIDWHALEHELVGPAEAIQTRRFELPNADGNLFFRLRVESLRK